jgi:hypothetical protein
VSRCKHQRPATGVGVEEPGKPDGQGGDRRVVLDEVRDAVDD